MTLSERFRGIVLQKSKVATPRIFRENKKRKMIADSYTLNRVAEIAGEFDARGPVPPHLYTVDAPTASRILDHLCKTTFATVSAFFGSQACASLRLQSRLPTVTGTRAAPRSSVELKSSSHAVLCRAKRASLRLSARL